VSTTSISFAKRPIIRPVGVVSKNVRGARRIPRNMIMCKIRAAAQQPSCGARSQKNDENAVSNITYIAFPQTLCKKKIKFQFLQRPSILLKLGNLKRSKQLTFTKMSLCLPTYKNSFKIHITQKYIYLW
jgi:hypothetical protein